MSPRTVMTCYWIVMIAAGAISFVTPASTYAGGTVAALLPGIVAAGAVALGVRLNRPRDAWPWILLAVALITNALGDTLFLVTNLIPGTPLSWADLLYVATIPCVLIAIVTLGSSDSPSRARSSSADALTVTGAEHRRRGLPSRPPAAGRRAWSRGRPVGPGRAGPAGRSGRRAQSLGPLPTRIARATG